MRVVFLIRSHSYYCSELSRALAANGNDVAMIMPSDGGEVPIPESTRPCDHIRSFYDERVAMHFIDYPKGGPKSILPSLRTTGEIFRIIKEFRPDVIHTQDLGDYRHLLAITRFKRIALVNTVHDANLHPGYTQDNIQRICKSKLRRMADRIIVHGKNIKERMIAQDYSPEKVAIVQHGSYTFYKRWSTEGICEEPTSILSFGKIHEYKGIEYLINAEPIISARIPDVKIIIAGAGEYWQKLEPLIKNPERFELNIRTIQDEEIADLFQRAAVVVLPYVEASQSGVLNIAYAFGKPVVVTSTGSLPEVVDEGLTGLIVPPSDSTHLADAIVKLLQNPDLRHSMGKKAYERATTGDLSWNNVAIETMKVYKEAIRKRRQIHEC